MRRWLQNTATNWQCLSWTGRWLGLATIVVDLISQPTLAIKRDLTYEIGMTVGGRVGGWASGKVGGLACIKTITAPLKPEN